MTILIFMQVSLSKRSKFNYRVLHQGGINPYKDAYFVEGLALMYMLGDPTQNWHYTYSKLVLDFFWFRLFSLLFEFYSYFGCWLCLFAIVERFKIRNRFTFCEDFVKLCEKDLWILISWNRQGFIFLFHNINSLNFSL